MESHEAVPLIPMRDVVVFPHTMMPFIIGRGSSIRAVEHALLKDKRVFLATQRDAAVEEPQPADVHTTGCIATVVQALKLPDGSVKALVEGIDRAKVVKWKEDRGFLLAMVNIVPRVSGGGDEAQMSRVVSLFEDYVKLTNNLQYDAMISAVRVDDPSKLADTIAAHLPISVDEKQNLVEIISPTDRLARLEEILVAEAQRLRTSPDPELSIEERRLLRRAVMQIVGSSDFVYADRIQHAAVAILSRASSTQDEGVFGDRGLSSTGMERMRELLERHELMLDVADAIARVLVTMVDDEEDDELASSLRSVVRLIDLLRTDAAATWARFGVERSTLN